MASLATHITGPLRFKINTQPVVAIYVCMHAHHDCTNLINYTFSFSKATYHCLTDPNFDLYTALTTELTILDFMQSQCIKLVLVAIHSQLLVHAYHRHDKVSLTEGTKICRFIDYVVKFKIFRATLSLQIYCLKSVGTKAPMGNPPMTHTHISRTLLLNISTRNYNHISCRIPNFSWRVADQEIASSYN